MDNPNGCNHPEHTNHDDYKYWPLRHHQITIQHTFQTQAVEAGPYFLKSNGHLYFIFPIQEFQSILNVGL